MSGRRARAGAPGRRRSLGGLVLALVAAALLGWLAFAPSGAGCRGGVPGLPAPDTSRMEPRVAHAVEEARARVLEAPGDAKAWGSLGAVLDVHGLTGDALVAYRRARELDPGSVRWAYQLAHLSSAGEADPAEVRALFAEAAALAPQYAPLPCREGDYLARLEQHGEAARAYRRALELDARFALAHRGLGLALLAAGEDPEEAVRHLEQAAELVPEDALSWSGLARARALVGDREGSEDAAARARDLEPLRELPDALRQEVAALGVSAALCARRASRYMQAGRYDEAARELAVVVETSPDDPRVQLQLGIALDRAGRPEEAAQAFRRAIGLDAGRADAHVVLGRHLSRRGDAAGAERSFRAAVAADPGSLEAHVALASELYRAGRSTAAVAEFEAADRLGDLDARALTDWGLALLAAGQPELAVARCRQALRLEPGSASANRAIARIFHRGDRLEEAVVYYLDALRAAPDDVEVRLDAGRALEALGRPAEALEQYYRLLEVDPEHPVARQLPALHRASGAPTPDPAEELARVAARLRDSDQRYLGERPAARLRERVADPRRTTLDRVNLLAELAGEELELGRVEQAVAAIDAAFEELARIPGMQASPVLVRQRARVYLRLAEVENCIRRRNASCCIFPLAGGGVHGVRAPIERAFADYRALLRDDPGDLGLRWLLNVCAMAMGEFPAAVPEELRLPPDAFERGEPFPRFVDVAPELGVDAFNLCGGVVAEDLDGDGWTDLATSSYDPDEPLRLYRSDGAGGFEERTEAAGLSGQRGGLNCVGADYDGDGDVDLLVLRGAWLLDDGRIRNSLLRNEGDGTFTDVTHAVGLALPARPTQAAAWADFDLDGDLDLYVANESRVDLGDAGGDFPSQLFLNDGGRFRDVARTAGVTNDRYGKGVAVGDYDDDGDPDLYVSNNGRNRLYRNDLDAGRGLTFTDVAGPLGVAEPSRRSFATWFFDYDQDGRLDLFVGAFETSIADLAAEALGLPPAGVAPRLYRNLGGTFEDVTARVGLDRMFLPMGANFGDVNGDGWLDVYLTTGDPDFETLVPNVMLLNDGGERFVDVSAAGGFGHLQKGHGVAFLDFDQDGDQDVYHQLGGFYPGDRFANALFENPGFGYRFLVVELVGTASNRAGYGARVALTVADEQGAERTLHRAVGSVSSFGGSPARLELGLGEAARLPRLEVRWPAGTVDTFTDLPLDARLRLTEGAPELERLPYGAAR